MVRFTAPPVVVNLKASTSLLLVGLVVPRVMTPSVSTVPELKISRLAAVAWSGPASSVR